MFKRNAFRLHSRHSILVGALAIGVIAFAAPAQAAPPLPLPFPFLPAPSDQPDRALSYAPVEPGAAAPSDDDRAAYQLPTRLRRQIVSYTSRETPGTVIIDTPNTYLYYIIGNGRALRYGIGVGRDGFTWSGVQSVTRKAEWPDWTPPPEMIARQPYLPRQMAGGPGNPLGARAMYLGGTMYRIHGTNAPETIGTHVSSGCIRLTNEDVSDLYSRVTIGARVIVLPMQRRAELGSATR
jgi:lipoprotein-anchoring transpeptidase ErfK/SrfK